MSNKKQKYKLVTKLVTTLLFFIALIESSLTGYLIYQDNHKKIQTWTYANNVASEFYTRLYFENPETLPKDLELYKENKFRFTIRNREGKPIVYKYKVYIDTNGDKRILQQNEIAIDNNESKTIEINYRLFIPLEASQVFVKLFYNQQKISFWIK